MTEYKILAAAFTWPDEASLRSEYVRLFTPTVAGGLPPYEMEYGKGEIFLKTQLLADVAGFYRAFGLDIAESSHERVDFIGAELEFMHWLALKEERAKERDDRDHETVCREAQAKFLRDHLGRWGGYFGDQIARSTQKPFYRRIGLWLSRFVEAECRRLGVAPKRVTGWTPDPMATTDLTCGPEDGSDARRDP